MQKERLTPHRRSLWGGRSLAVTERTFQNTERTFRTQNETFRTQNETLRTQDGTLRRVVADIGSARPMRPTRRRWMKFEDVIRRFCQDRDLGEWQRAAADRDKWDGLVAEFAAWATRTLVN